MYGDGLGVLAVGGLVAFVVVDGSVAVVVGLVFVVGAFVVVVNTLIGGLVFVIDGSGVNVDGLRVNIGFVVVPGVIIVFILSIYEKFSNQSSLQINWFQFYNKIYN